MFRLLRTRGAAALFTVFAAFFANPSTAIAAQAIPLAPESVPAVVTVAPIAPTPSLEQFVLSYVDYRDQDAQELCLAKAIYFEARGESLQGQLAVADVVLNRVASERYPDSICKVVTQKAQFSFIRRGNFPRPNMASKAWHKALAIAEVAQKRLHSAVAPNVLWYHATYVAPSWGKRLTRTARIGTHIFYA